MYLFHHHVSGEPVTLCYFEKLTIYSKKQSCYKYRSDSLNKSSIPDKVFSNKFERNYLKVFERFLLFLTEDTLYFSVGIILSQKIIAYSVMKGSKCSLL